jgi:betaine-aldehyde dehydrogenase
VQTFDLYIGGKLKSATDGRIFECWNPSNGELIACVADASVNDVRFAIQAARTAFDNRSWSGLSVSERGRYLVQIAKAIREHVKELADWEGRDTGKISKQTTFIDVPTCADTFEYFGKVRDIDKPKKNPVAAPVNSETRYEPMGVVGCIIPWNYPLIMAGWKIAPALVAGNTVVFKPSSWASASIMKLAEIIHSIGLPAGVLNIVSSSDHSVGAEIVQSHLVDMVSFTGGTETGQSLMKLAADTTKKLSLELGGKSPNIVFADCDFEAAVGGAMSAIFMNQGQMCTAGSRLLLEEGIYHRFLKALVERTKALKIGDAADYTTQFGPLISAEHRDKVKRYIELGISEGAKLECGGKVPEGPEFEKGVFLEPTIFSEVTNNMIIAQEEIFGPVLSVIKFSTEKEAVQLANNSAFGLASMIWTRDLEKADRVAKQMESGIVWINTYGGFYNEASFGGHKRSGSGRELGDEGLREYMQTKHVCIDRTPGGRPLVSAWF